MLQLDLRRVPALTADVAVVGSGVAALTAALAAAEEKSVLVLTKGVAGESNSWYAQGGVAAAIAEEDSPEAHLRDTLEAGAGLCFVPAVERLVTEGPRRIRALQTAGLSFDAENGREALTLEGGHSCRRVLHAGGDATGRSLVEHLLDRVRRHPNIAFLERHFMVDLLHRREECGGLLAMDIRRETPTNGNGAKFLRIEARATILAAGGAGQIYRETTNPECATADGIAASFRAGADVQDMEFVQFHPTALYLAGAPRFLISEAARGEGGWLLNDAGERFMFRYDSRGELAPRDVVSQGIVEEMIRTGSTNVWLTLAHLDPDLVRRRFPTIAETLRKYRLELAQDRIPVRPAAHYLMGGIRTDLDGRTNIARLFAAGETACTGLHGANRLASNSLLEALVFGHAAGLAAVTTAAEPLEPWPLSEMRPEPKEEIPLDVWDVRNSLKSLLGRAAGVRRSGETLAAALKAFDFWRQYVFAGDIRWTSGLELRNMLTCGQLVVHGALRREESRGAHQRVDFPETNPAWAEKRVVLNRRDFESA
jgi:L-aspartate oxidase